MLLLSVPSLGGHADMGIVGCRFTAAVPSNRMRQPQGLYDAYLAGSSLSAVVEPAATCLLLQMLCWLLPGALYSLTS